MGCRMKIREYAQKNTVDPLVLYAGEYLELEGEIFGFGFTLVDAIDKAAESLTVFLDEIDWDEERRKIRLRERLGGWT